MECLRSAKGKKRARDLSPTSSLSSMHSDIPIPVYPVKKPKRAETRPCPACAELIPVRLLAAHAALETQRVEDIIRHIGEAEILAEVDDLEEGPSNRVRRSALKARKSLTTSIPFSSTSPSAIGKAIQTITRRRKARHLRLKELAKEDEAESWNMEVDGGTSCPVCAQVIRGDRDVVEAHVDACLAHESARLERLQEEEEELDIDGGGSVRTRVITSASLRGTGIHVRTSDSADVEDEVDIDGEDEAVFGKAQFDEADVLALPSTDHDLHIWNEDIDGDIDGKQGTAQERQTLRNLVIESKSLATRADSSGGIERGILPPDMDQLDLAIFTARSRNDSSALIIALENKIKALESNTESTSSLNLCRICLSQYTEPTVSTGCWHTCCRECWLRCLGATKLCPMCQRITSAVELRRVYI